MHLNIQSSTIYNNQGIEANYMSIDRGMDKEYIYNRILLSLKKNEIMPFAVMWVHPDIVKLSEVSQIQKDRNHMMTLICGI